MIEMSLCFTELCMFRYRWHNINSMVFLIYIHIINKKEMYIWAEMSQVKIKIHIVIVINLSGKQNGHISYIKLPMKSYGFV